MSVGAQGRQFVAGLGHGYQETAHVDEVVDQAASLDQANDLGAAVGAPLLIQIRTGATDERVTRVTETVRLGNLNRLIWETGTDSGLEAIRQQHKR